MIKNIKKDLLSKAVNPNMKHVTHNINTDMHKKENKCNAELYKLKSGHQCDSDSEDEENRIWQPISDKLSDVKGSISSINDPVFDWNLKTKDGRRTNRNFNNWLDDIVDKLHTNQKKQDDNELFG